jgi:hypothetical protein
VNPETVSAEDGKLITLARSTRARGAAPEGAAVRDETGRTYTAATVNLPSLQLSALRLAVAMASSSGAEKLEAAAVVGAAGPGAALDPADVAAVRDLGRAAPIFHATPDGTVRAVLLPPGQPHRPLWHPVPQQRFQQPGQPAREDVVRGRADLRGGPPPVLADH